MWRPLIATEERASLDVEETFLDYLRGAPDSGKAPAEVVMVMPRPGGRILLITKPFYPDGLHRLPTGRLHAAESPEDALVRETAEETGLTVHDVNLAGTILYAVRSQEQETSFTSYVFLTEVIRARPHPLDETEQITGYREASPAELWEVAEMLERLEGRWRDWGRFRAVAHRNVAGILSAEDS